MANMRRSGGPGQTRRASPVRAAACLALVLAGGVDAARAAYGNMANTQVDPALMRIDEDKYLGVTVARNYAMVDTSGDDFTLGDMLGKPLVLVLSYFSCDGACPTVNAKLNATLRGVTGWTLGKDYRVLTVSFDPHDSPERRAMFLHSAGFDKAMPAGWRVAMLKDAADIRRLTESVGFNFFWSPRDRMFLHPNVYIMVSPQGRVVRYLYGTSIAARDMEISITKAWGNQLSAANVINFVFGACYSYNYEDGKYSINYPLFIAAGALAFGVCLIVGAALIMKHKKRVMA